MEFGHQLSDLTNDMMGIFDSVGKLLLFNKRWGQILGWSDEELRQKDYSFFVHPEDLEPSIIMGRNLRETAVRVENFENRWKCKNGTYRFIRWNFSYDANLQQINAAGTDVTFLKRDYHLLEETQRIANIAGWEVNFVTGSTYWTPEAFKLHGVTPTDYTPHFSTIFDFYDEDSKVKLFDSQKTLLGGRTPQALDLVLVTPKGERKDVRAHAIPIVTENEVTGAIGTLMNVTETKHFQEELIKTKEKALAATEAKSVFLANMSHEIRTPMNSILGMADLLLDSNLDEEQRQFVTILNRAAGSLLDVINDILDMSRIEAGQLQVQRVPFNLRETIAKSLEIFHHKASEKNLILSNLIDDNVPETWIGDPQRLRQVLINLVGNAVKFTERGSVQIKTNYVHSKIIITVTDSGIGIAHDQLDRIFERFTQGDASITRRYGGTGLGLHITKNLVEKMEGQISVASELGQGTSFQLILPTLN